MTISPSNGMLYHLRHEPKMELPVFSLSDDAEDFLNAELPPKSDHEKKTGCFIHCHESDLSPIECASTLQDKIAKVQACIHFTAAVQAKSCFNVGKDLAAYEMEKDKNLLKKLETQLEHLNRI